MPNKLESPVIINRVDEESPIPNVKFIGKRTYFDKESGEGIYLPIRDEDVPIWRRDGPTVFNLPAGSIQKKGFYHEDAVKLVTAWPLEFKLIVAKGGENV